MSLIEGVRDGTAASRAEEAKFDAAARDENFPVASRLLAPALRGRVMAFYRFARAADDAADDPRASPEARQARLDVLEGGLRGARGDGAGAALRRALAEGRAPRDAAALREAAGLMPAFRRDAAGGTACADWDDLMGYCRSSAASVGRVLLALHGEGQAARAPSDALCAALQVLNHLQDMGGDHRLLGRRYLPGDWMAEAGARDAELGAPSLSPALARVVARTLDGVDALLAEAAPLPGRIAARGLRGQAAATLWLARRLTARLRRGDPLAARVALSRLDFARAALAGLWAAAR
ncbi:squalene synthase HpnC [Jannaschia formosa]|nr:squalene synthase HpnC [Jannaschia formosa]